MYSTRFWPGAGEGKGQRGGGRGNGGQRSRGGVSNRFAVFALKRFSWELATKYGSLRMRDAGREPSGERRAVRGERQRSKRSGGHRFERRTSRSTGFSPSPELTRAD